MIIACPSCQAKFRLDAEKLGSKGRRLRCSQCSHQWHQDPEEKPADAVAGTVLDQLDAVERASENLSAKQKEAQALSADMAETDAKAQAANIGVAASTEAPPKTRALKSSRPLIAVGIAAVAVLSLALVAVMERQSVVAALPELSSLYAAVGLETAEHDGLELQDVASERRLIDGQIQLIIRGMVVNTSEKTLSIPPLMARLGGAADAEVMDWTLHLEPTVLSPGAGASFEAVSLGPVAEDSEIFLDFQPPKQ